mgnify:CR=1 FL=1
MIFSKRFELFHTPFEARLLDDPISAIYTPFSIILVYEIYLLIMYLPRSFTTAVSKQFEIISLILIRRIFGDIPKIELDVNWIENTANRRLIYDLIGVLILYFLIYQFNKHQNKITKKELTAVLVLPKLDQDTKEMLKIYQNQNAYQYCIQLMSIPEYQLC